jgi:hypothetical protein
VRLTRGVLGFSTQAYYAWLARPVSPREVEDAYLTNALVDAHTDDPEFGYRFLTDELEWAGGPGWGRPKVRDRLLDRTPLQAAPTPARPRQAHPRSSSS